MKNHSSKYFPVIVIFLIVTALVFLFKSQLIAKGFDTKMLLGANVFLLLIHLISFFLQRNSIDNKNPNAFVRAVMGGMMMKMFSCIIAVFVYVSLVDKDYNKKSLFTALILYLFYLAAEVYAISASLKKSNHG